MAFADLTLRSEIWNRLGLRCLLCSVPVPAEKSLCAGSAFSTRPALKKMPARPQSSNQPTTKPHAAAKPNNPIQQTNLALMPYADMSTWPISWQKCLQRTPPAQIIWTYRELGQDLLRITTPGLDERRALLARLWQDLKPLHRTNTLWPFAMPNDSGSAIQAEPAIFWTGVRLLKARFVMVLDDAAHASLALPETLNCLGQTRWNGIVICAWWGMSELLAHDGRYADMLACCRRTLSDLGRGA